MSVPMTTQQANATFVEALFVGQQGQQMINDYLHQKQAGRGQLPRLDKSLTDEALQSKAAADTGLRSETKLMLREGDLVDACMPPYKVASSDFDRAVDTEYPIIIFQRETLSPGAVTASFGSQPPAIWAAGKKYIATIQKRETAKLTKSQLELLTYDGDPRAQMVDAMLNELSASKNARWISLVRKILVGPDVNTAFSGIPQWQTLTGGISRLTIPQFPKILLRTFSRIPPKRILMNNITVYDFATFDLIEKGDDWNGTQLLKDGVGSVRTVMGMDMMVTIQHNLIRENEWFGFADPAFMGKHIVFREPAVTVEVKGDHVSVHANAYDGLTFANPNSICIAHFAA